MSADMGQAFGRDSSVKQFLKPYQALFDDNKVTEIAVNGPNLVFFEKDSRWQRSEDIQVGSSDIKTLGVAIAKYTEQTWTKNYPLLSASMPGGLRIQLVDAPAVEEGRQSITIRKPSLVDLRLDDFDAAGLFDHITPASTEVSDVEMNLLDQLGDRNYKQFFKTAVKHRMNIVVSGKTGSGKTTFMKGLVHEIPLTERLVTIEDVRELYVPHLNAVHLLYSKGDQSHAKVTPKDLLEACLRMKPDRILLAELRSDECLYYVRNAASGHPGSITSCHAGSTALAFEQLALMIQDSPGGANLDFANIMRLLKLTIDIVVQFGIKPDGGRGITEIYFDPKGKRKLQS
jgi:type IV secretion system protein VirB11